MKKIAIDTYYYSDTDSYTVGVVFSEFTDQKPIDIISVHTSKFGSYVPGQFYKRELPGVLDLLKLIDLKEFDTIILDSYYSMVDQVGKVIPGLGEKLDEKLGRPDWITIIGVAKSLFGRSSEICKEVIRGEAMKPLYVSSRPGEDLDFISEEIKSMYGPYRLPYLLKLLDTETKKYK